MVWIQNKSKHFAEPSAVNPAAKGLSDDWLQHDAHYSTTPTSTNSLPLLFAVFQLQ